MENLEIDESQFRLGSYGKRTLDEQQDRNGFIKKVYGIVCAQLCVTTLITSLPFLSDSFRTFMQETPALMALCTVGVLVIQCVLLCCK